VTACAREGCGHARSALTDENGCFTLPDGSCVSPGPCLHTPTDESLVQAVAPLLSEHGFVSNGADHYCGCGGVKFEVWPQWDAYCEHIAEVAVAVLVPLIRAQVAERIAALYAHPEALPVSWRMGQPEAVVFVRELRRALDEGAAT